MRLSTINKLCCPFDKADLELTSITEDTEKRILEGWLHCKECKPLLEKWSKHLEGKTVQNFRLIEGN